MNKSNDTSEKIDEIVNTGAVAVNMDRRQLRSGEADWRREMAADADRSTMRLGAHEVNKTKEQLEKAKALLKAKKRARFKDFAGNIFRRRLANEGIVLTYKILSEANIPDVVSRLKGLENKNQPRSSDTTTFGVEDDEGNIMKVTVKSEQAKDFENKLALELGEIQTDKIYGYQKTNISMAELLYNLKNEFEIIDVEFPTIPADVIYNADKASYDNGQNDEFVEGQTDMPPEDSEMDDMSDIAQDTQIPPEDSEMDDMEGMDGDMEDMDDESVEEFSDEEPEGFESMYQSLIQMMMAQAQAAKAQAEAEAEKARAITAEFTAKAATSELQKEEELARMNAELEKQKEKEKEAKKLANLAKFRVQQGKDFSTDTFEGFKSPLNSIMEQIEGEALENEQMIRKQMTTAKQQYAISASDDPDTRAYKQQTLQATMDELNARLKKTKIATLYNNKLRQKNAQQPQQNNQGNQNQQNQQNNNNPNQRDAARGSLNTGQQSNNGGGV